MKPTTREDSSPSVGGAVHRTSGGWRSTPDVIAHRAAGGDAPENSLAGIRYALEGGADGVEVDVRALRDGTLVLMHDATLERTAGDPRGLDEIVGADLPSIRLLDGSGHPGPEPLPTLEEALAVLPEAAIVVIDVCQRGIVDAIATVAAARTRRSVRFTGPDARELAALRTRVPGSSARLSVPVRNGDRRAALRAIAVARMHGLDGINPHHRLVDEELVAAARTAGFDVATWTVNDRDEARRLVSAGVVSLTSDVPLIVRAALA